jgi:hypothetical protein
MDFDELYLLGESLNEEPRDYGDSIYYVYRGWTLNEWADSNYVYYTRFTKAETYKLTNLLGFDDIENQICTPGRCSIPLLTCLYSNSLAINLPCLLFVYYLQPLLHGLRDIGVVLSTGARSSIP